MITEEYNQKENWYHNGMSVSKIVKSVTTENKKGMKKICCNNIIAIKLVLNITISTNITSNIVIPIA